MHHVTAMTDRQLKLKGSFKQEASSLQTHAGPLTGTSKAMNQVSTNTLPGKACAM